MMRYYYASSVKEFMLANDILQTLTINSEFDIAQTQRAAWIEEIHKQLLARRPCIFCAPFAL